MGRLFICASEDFGKTCMSIRKSLKILTHWHHLWNLLFAALSRRCFVFDFINWINVDGERIVQDSEKIKFAIVGKQKNEFRYKKAIFCGIENWKKSARCYRKTHRYNKMAIVLLFVALVPSAFKKYQKYQLRNFQTINRIYKLFICICSFAESLQRLWALHLKVIRRIAAWASSVWMICCSSETISHIFFCWSSSNKLISRFFFFFVLVRWRLHGLLSKCRSQNMVTWTRQVQLNFIAECYADT